MVLVLYPAYPRLLQTLPGLDSSFKGSIGAAQRTPDGGLHAELRRTEYTTTSVPPLLSIVQQAPPVGLVPPSTAESSPGTPWIGAPFHRVDTNRFTVQGRIPPTKPPKDPEAGLVAL